LLPIVVILAACSPELGGREAGPQRSTDSAVNAHFAAAQQAQDRQDYATAEREYRAVLAVFPDFAEIHMNLDLIYQLQNRSDEAMTEFRRALKIKPKLTGANFFLGVGAEYDGTHPRWRRGRIHAILPPFGDIPVVKTVRFGE